MNALIPTVIAMLRTTTARWQALVEALPGDLLTRPAAAGEWSALECLQHMVDVEKLYQFRLKSFLAGQDFPAFNPDSEGSQPGAPAAIVVEFTRLRRDTLLALADLAPEDLGRRVRHQELGLVTLEQMLHTWAAHDLNHTVQAERALMQPFIAGCGAWQRYYTDHYLQREE